MYPLLNAKSRGREDRVLTSRRDHHGLQRSQGDARRYEEMDRLIMVHVVLSNTTAVSVCSFSGALIWWIDSKIYHSVEWKIPLVHV